MIPYASIARRGNGFAVGEMTGPGCERWHVFLHIKFGGDRW